MTQGGLTDVAICMVAHNEEDNIEAAIRSLGAATGSCTWRAWVVANGCTDHTVSKARIAAQEIGNVEVVDLPFGDKCNAWNHFVHHIDAAAAAFAFMDGDVRATRDSILNLFETLRARPTLLAATALPRTGRWRESFRQALLDEGGLAGNLYMLSGQFVQRLRQKRVTLPVGIVGDDSLLGAIAMWDLDPRAEWRKDRVAVCEHAEFEFDSLPLFSPTAALQQFKRMVRYSRRRFENQMLGSSLRSRGLEALPADRAALYSSNLHQCKIEWRGTSTLFDWLALREMRAVRANTHRQ